jgi:hypothetical protein
MGGAKTLKPEDLLKGGVLQCAEAITFGMPFEVWKTYMGTYREVGTIQAFRNVYKMGGVGAFWKGWQPKMVESFLKGGVLLFSKEAIIRTTKSFGFGDVTSGVLGGFGGGVCQVSVMGPCTFLITASVAASADGVKMTMMQRISKTYAEGGIGGFYRGGTALMLRQGSNWASRQGITDFVRGQFRSMRNLKDGERLSIADEAISGILGGSLSTWNQPFEVMRIEAQAAAARGLPAQNIVQTASKIVKENGVAGLFQGIIPRMGLGIAQTVFMVTLPKIMARYGY